MLADLARSTGATLPIGGAAHWITIVSPLGREVGFSGCAVKLRDEEGMLRVL